DGAFGNGFVFEQTVFDFGRRDENAADFQHFVGPSAVPEIAFGVARELVARRAVIAGEGLFRLLVRLPVTNRRGIAFDPQRSHLSVWRHLSIGADDLGLVTGHDLAQTALAHVAEAIRNVNVKHLRRPNAVQDLNAERIFPSAVKLRRQRFAGRDADAQAAPILFAPAPRVEHPRGYRPPRGQPRPTITVYHFQTPFRR